MKVVPVRTYHFDISLDDDGLPEVEFSAGQSVAEIEDMRLIISLCCTLILRQDGVPSDIIERVKRIQVETELEQRLH